MKKIILIILIISPRLGFSQLSERNIVKENNTETKKYDATHNFMHHKKLSDYKMYIGEQFYVLPINYDGYVRDEDKSRFKDLRYKTPRPYYKDDSMKKNKKNLTYKNLYKSDDNDKIVPYDSVANKTFKVIGFDESQSKIITDGYNKLHFTLLDESINDTLVWTPSIYEFHYPNSIVILSYLEKIKKDNINQQFFTTRNMEGRNEKPYVPPYYGYLVNIKNGKPVFTKEFETWKCIDVSLLNIYSGAFKLPMLIFENDKNEEIGVFFLPEGDRELSRPSVDKDFISVSTFKGLCETFGDENGKTIALNKVKIGMTKEMCILSWGMPKDINKTVGNYGVHEQWVYGTGSYLYFENDILTNIQN